MWVEIVVGFVCFTIMAILGIKITVDIITKRQAKRVLKEFKEKDREFQLSSLPGI